MLTLCVRHSPKCSAKYKLGIKDIGKCRCPLMVMGKDHHGVYHNREALGTRELPLAYEMMGRIERGEPRPVKRVDPTLPEALKQYRIILLTGRGLQESTLKSGFDTMRRQMVRQAEEMEIEMLSEAGPAYLDALIAGWQRLRRSTRVKRIGALKRFFARAHARKWITDNPALLLEIPLSNEEDGRTAPFNAEEDERIMWAAWAWEKSVGRANREAPWRRHPRTATAFLLLLRHTGLRFSDATMFQPEKLVKRVVDGEEMYCIEALRQRKTDHPMFMPLEKQVAEEILGAKRISREWMFWDGKTEMNTWNSRFRIGVTNHLERVSGVAHIHPHRFRDTFAAYWLSHGMDIRAVSRLLGHTDVAITLKHYEHYMRKDHDVMLGTIMRVRKENVIAFPGREGRAV